MVAASGTWAFVSASLECTRERKRRICTFLIPVLHSLPLTLYSPLSFPTLVAAARLHMIVVAMIRAATMMSPPVAIIMYNGLGPTACLCFVIFFSFSVPCFTEQKTEREIEKEKEKERNAARLLPFILTCSRP